MKNTKTYCVIIEGFYLNRKLLGFISIYFGIFFVHAVPDFLHACINWVCLGEVV